MERRFFLAGVLATAAFGMKGAAEERNVVLASNEVYPLLYHEGERLTGYLFDLISEAARRGGIPVEIRSMPWARCVEETRSGGIDGLFVTFHTAERDSYMAFPSEPLMVQRICLYARQGSGIRYGGHLEELSALRIAVSNRVSNGPNFDEAVRKGLLSNLEPVNGPESMVRMLLGGRVDLMVLHDLEADGLLRRLGAADQVIKLSPPLDEVPGYIAFTRQRDTAPVMAAFDRALAEMRRDGSYRRLQEVYFP